MDEFSLQATSLEEEYSLLFRGCNEVGAASNASGTKEFRGQRENARTFVQCVSKIRIVLE